MKDHYRPVVEGLRVRSVSSYLQNEDQLVISRQVGLVLPTGSNSFWITHHEGSWYLCTWSPRCYRVPPEADLVGLCVLFAGFGSKAQAEVPAKIVDRFGISELSDEEAAETFGW